MPELLRPDVYVEEVASPPGVPVIPVSNGGFVGVADRGPVDDPTMVDSFTAYVRRFGEYRSDSFLTHAVEGFFAQGGARCYIVRVTDPDGSPLPAAATLDFADVGGDTTAYTMSALDVGLWGNSLRLGTTKAETLLNEVAGITGTVTQITVDSVAGFAVGDVIYLDDGTDTAVTIIKAIDLTTKKFTLAEPLTLGATNIGDNARVATASQHRVSTQLKVGIPASAITSFKVTNPANVRVGQIITVFDGTTLFEVVVTSVTGEDVGFASATPGGAIAAGSPVVSQEFKLTIIDGNEFYSYEFLAPVSTNKEDYVENRLAGESNESLIIEMAETSSSVGYEMIPVPITDGTPSGGADGQAPGDADYMGTGADKRGLHALDVVQDVNFIAVPGITTTAVQGYGIDYCENRGDCAFVNDGPQIKDLPEEIRDWRLNTLNKDSSFGALYYPWVRIADPEVDGQILSIPPSGDIMGVWAYVSRTQGPHVPPANITLRRVLGLDHDTTDGEHDTLNPIGVNVIRAYPGEGIRIMGARTLQSKPDGKHYVNVRLLTNFIKASLKRGLRQYLMRPIDPKLWEAMAGTCESFLRGIWRDGMLYPSDAASQAYSVKVDKENNPQDVIDQGRVNVDAGYNPPMPAEFIVLRLARIGGAITVSE